MGKVISKVYIVSNMEVRLQYSWNKKLDCPEIANIGVFYKQADITDYIGTKRLYNIIEQINEALVEYKEELRAEFINAVKLTA